MTGARGEQCQKDFSRTASTSQIQSLDILHQWWSGKLRGPIHTLLLQNALQKAQLYAEGWESPSEDSTPRSIRVANQIVVLPEDPGCYDSKYAHDLLILWLHEFYFDEKDVDAEFISNLEITRQGCQSVAVTHRLAHAVFSPFTGGRPRSRRLPEAVTIGEPAFGAGTPCPWLDMKADRFSDEATRRKKYPFYLWHITDEKTVETSSLAELPSYWVLSHTWGRWRKNEAGKNISCAMDNVPWPVPENYLFQVQELPGKLKKLRSTWPCLDYVWIDLFCIPQEGADPQFDQINKTEIANQAQIFRMATWAVVWMNQVDSWAGLEQALKWLVLHYIGHNMPLKQRGLYEVWEEAMSALNSNCPATLGDRETLEGQPATSSEGPQDEDSEVNSLRLDGLHLVQKDSASAPVQTDSVGSGGVFPVTSITGFADIISVKNAPDASSLGFQGIKRLAALKPAPYLTGLWTLQEACLCPTMRFLNKDLEPLLMGTCRQEITLDTICALLDVHNSQSFIVQPSGYEKGVELINIALTSDLSEMPLGVMEVIGAFTATGLSRLLTISATDLLELGSRRWCPHSRGPAIMSAVGVTAWFEGQSVPHLKIEDPSELVLGHYPYQFVQEVADKAGAVFYASRREKIRQTLLSSSPEMNIVSCHGTMLPFYYGAYTGRFWPEDFEDHSSVATWTINRNGSVFMKEAAILMATDRPKPPLIPGKVFIEPWLARTLVPVRIEDHDLFRILQHMSGDGTRGTLYALVLMSNATRIEGIIINKMVFGMYVKCGNFDIGPGYDVSIPVSETVNWVIG